MGHIYHSITDLIGDTPLLQLHKYPQQHGIDAHIFAKLELFNPTGSVKARAV